MRNLQSYHHGNLKQALLKASLELIRKSGPGAFTLREVARRAGVSHNAPYRHFHNKEDLLAALAAEGFDRLAEAMNKAVETVSGALERFRASGRGYVQFALRHPQHFAVMFDVPWRPEQYPEARAAGERAFGCLVGFVEACQAEALLPPGDPRPCALLAWTTVHGIAKLAIGGRLPVKGLSDALRFTDLATAALEQGMAKAVKSGGRGELHASRPPEHEHSCPSPRVG